MSERRQYYGFLDLVRLYCALLIVVIHMGYGDSFSVVPCLTRQGVPFFFLVSGFFLSKKLRKSETIRQTVIRYIKPILAVYIVWILFWLPSNLIEYGRIYPDSPVILTAVLFRRFFLAGMAPYWYLLVLAEGAVLLAVVIRYRKTAIGLALCILGIALGILYSYQAENNPSGLTYRMFYTVFSWSNNVIMTGFPLLFLGAMADQYEERIRKANFWGILFLYVVSVVIAFVVYDSNKFFFHIPFGIIQATILFCLCLIPVSLLQNLPENICRGARNLSSVVFLTHTVFLTILGLGLHLWNGTLRYVITVLCAVVLYVVVKKLNWRPLNKLLMVK